MTVVWVRNDKKRDKKKRRGLERPRRFFSLVYDIRKETHVPGTFNGTRELTLMLRGCTGVFTRLNATIWIQKLLQKLNILIIDILDVVFGKIALHR
jgi:hypothetical protein